MKSVQNKSETKSTLKDYKENKDSEMVMEKDKKTNNISKPQFKCKTCGAKFRKENTMNKHYNTKHEEQSFKVCGLRFETSLEVLQHVAKEHSENIIGNISIQEKEN